MQAYKNKELVNLAAVTLRHMRPYVKLCRVANIDSG